MSLLFSPIKIGPMTIKKQVYSFSYIRRPCKSRWDTEKKAIIFNEIIISKWCRIYLSRLHVSQRKLQSRTKTMRNVQRRPLICMEIHNQQNSSKLQNSFPKMPSGSPHCRTARKKKSDHISRPVQFINENRNSRYYWIIFWTHQNKPKKQEQTE